MTEAPGGQWQPSAELRAIADLDLDRQQRRGYPEAVYCQFKTPEQLREQLVALKKEAFNLRFQQATGQIESTARMRAVRKDVARVLTVMNQKAAAAAQSN